MFIADEANAMFLPDHDPRVEFQYIKKKINSSIS